MPSAVEAQSLNYCTTMEVPSKHCFVLFLFKIECWGFLKIFIYLSIYLRRVSVAVRRIFVAACGIFSCGTQDLVP